MGNQNFSLLNVNVVHDARAQHEHRVPCQKKCLFAFILHCFLLRFMSSDYPFGIVKLFLVDITRHQ